jgi:cytochrome c-type biogenesis protein CcmH
MLRAFLLLLALAGPARAVTDPAELLPDPAQEQRARAIGRELRCLVCQNESIEDSNADLARDLRRIVREQVAAGRSETEVKDYLRARYGEFVLLNPRFSAATAVLWAMPALALGGGLLLVLALRRRRGAAEAPAPLSAEEQARLRELSRE